MKIKLSILLGVSILFVNAAKAQQKTSLKLEEAIQLAWKNSNETALAATKVKTKELELKNLKNQQYPDLKASAQYQRLANASIDLKQSGGGSGSDMPAVNQLMIGQVNASLPIFNGFKLKNNIESSKNLLLAE
ncbi:MAG: outer membrane protein, partial [Bacteroidota bacterium]|nr:outer membrane protein [Bacteroidota bacterium]